MRCLKPNHSNVHAGETAATIGEPTKKVGESDFFQVKATAIKSSFGANP